MNIDWRLSDDLLVKCKKIENYRKEGKTWGYITKQFGQSRPYLATLYKAYLKEKGVI